MTKKCGKKKGSPKTGGRTKGTVNKLTEEYKDIIALSSPVEFLIEAFTIGRIEGNVNPLHKEDEDKYLTLTYKERCDIARSLSNKIVPDLKSVDHGELRGTMNFIIKTAIPHAPNEKPKVVKSGE